MVTRIQKNLLAKLGKRFLSAPGVVGLVSAILIGAENTGAQVAGSSTIGVTKEEMKAVMRGWSAKKKLLGKAVYNDKNQKIGEIEDLIITPDKQVSYAIIGVGGFLEIGEHHVAVRASQLKVEQDKIILPGATKESLKAMPKFEYA